MFDDFPQTASEFDARFGSDDACWEYLFEKRWPGGFVCPSCSGRAGWQLTRGRCVECSACGRQTSVTAGTVLHKTKKPLRVWFKAIFLVTTLKTGVSAKALERILGLTYKVAWTWMHKLRAAMAMRPKERLQGRVEVDDTYVGGKDPFTPGRSAGAKAVVFVGVEDRGLRSGRLRLDHLPNASADSLVPAVEKNVAPGSRVHTDQWRGYARLRKSDFDHLAEKAGRTEASMRFPHVHRAISLLKRVLLGTFQGSVSRKHLLAYLEEFEFRFNRRSTRHAPRIADALLGLIVNSPPCPYREIMRGASMFLRRAA